MQTDFITQLLQLGVGGIDLKRSIDLISPMRLVRMTNFRRNEEGRLQIRLGQRRLAWGAGATVHSMERLQAALAGGEFLRFAGIGGGLYVGVEGPLAELVGGFSGQPLAFVHGHPPLSGDSWMYVGDSAKMVKVRASDRLVLPIGLRPPATPVVAVVGSDNQTLIDNCDAAGWTNNAGSATAGTPSNASSTNAKAGAASTAFTSSAGSVSGAYYNFWAKAASPSPRDLSKLTGVGGITPSSDDDQIHLWLRMDKPNSIDEIRLYFVISNDFDLATLPGTSTTKNTNSYVKGFIPGMFTPLVEATDSASVATADAVAQRALEQSLQTEITRAGNAEVAAQQQSETAAIVSRRLALGRGQWTEFGSVGIPLRRGEFLRIGSDITRDWSTVTGLVAYVRVNDGSVVVVQIDDCYMRGGYNPDTSEPTASAYDYVYRNYDPRTGAKSRYSPLMASTSKVDVIRQNVRLIPEAYGDPAVRQQFFRRGGTLPSDFYFVGQNRSDGGCGKDNTADAEAVAAGAESEDDFHQPVTTEDVAGNAIYAQPIPVIFGPAPSAGILFGLGDPYRPGHIYWTLPDQYDHWPRLNRLEVCAPDEELMNGGIFSGQAFCFSRGMLYSLLVSIVDGKVVAQPTACAKGLAARWAMAIGLDGIYFVSTDGVWKTSGGMPQNITDDFLEPLFRGLRSGSYAPVDLAAASGIRLGIFQNELWLRFQDVDGGQQVWIYSQVFQFWRHYSFAWPVASFCAENEQGGHPRLLLGAAASGRIYEHFGTHDDGLAIQAVARTGALNQGTPRQLKLYGDLELEADLAGVVAQVVTYADLETRIISSKLVQPQAGGQVYLIDAFGSSPVQAKDVSLEIALSSFGTSPWIGRAGPSYVPQPESSLGRLTEWDELGSGANKILKGILIEADTFGYQKVLQVMVDGSTTPATQFTLQTTGRQFIHVAFDSQVEARVVRLVPADSAPWIPYEMRWTFDVDPLDLPRWETQETDHGVQGEQTLLTGYVKLKSTEDVTLQVTVTRADGTLAVGQVVIPSTSGAREKRYITFPVLKGTLFKYLFTTAGGSTFRLYREESVIYVQPWAGDQPVPVQPFGTDDLDVQRLFRDAEGALVRGARFVDQQAGYGKS